MSESPLHPPHRLHLLRREFPGRAVYDTAVSHAMLRRVGSGSLPPSLRLYRPDDVVVFSLLDARRPGFERAVEVARAAGFGAVIRLAGGHAAVFHSETLAFSWARPSEDARLGIGERFEEMAELTCRALRVLGVDARVGEVPREYCPGEHSVNARGCVKLMGVGQRVIRGAAHVGGLIAVGGGERIREVLVPVYEALELDWDPATAGCLVDELGDVSLDDVRDVLISELRGECAIDEADFDDETLALAEELEEWHRPGANARGAVTRVGGKALRAR
jgi:lipoate-protein ligase A